MGRFIYPGIGAISKSTRRNRRRRYWCSGRERIMPHDYSGCFASRKKRKRRLEMWIQFQVSVMRSSSQTPQHYQPVTVPSYGRLNFLDLQAGRAHQPAWNQLSKTQ